jgi:hypothetical protein
MASYGEQDSVLQLVNLALSKLQRPAIDHEEWAGANAMGAGAGAQTSSDADAARANLPSSVKACLEFRRWSFATTVAELQPILQETPEDDGTYLPVNPRLQGIPYDRKFQIPGNCVSIIDVLLGSMESMTDIQHRRFEDAWGILSDPHVPLGYELLGDGLYGPANAKWVRYVSYELTPQAIRLWPSAFKYGVVNRLAGEIAGKVGGSQGDAQRLMMQSEEELLKAAMDDAKQGGIYSGY